jgi:Sulfotransferase family
MTTLRKAAGRVKRRLTPGGRAGTTSIPEPKLLDAGDRLVPSPVFLYSSERSGSTLLRMMLDCHSDICAPHEMHLRTLQASFSSWFGETAWKELGVRQNQLADLLWDRLLHMMLTRTDTSIIVDKTPANLNIWKRINRSWPEARYIFLKRHPLRVAESLAAAKPDVDMQQHYDRVNKYLTSWVAARAVLPGPTVSYEELTVDPESVLRKICDHLDVPFQPAMLDYGSADHSGSYRRGLGDWNEKIKSGVVHAADPLPKPEDVPEELREVCRQLGYL